MKISTQDLKEKIVVLMTSKNFTEEDAGNVANYLVWAEMSGIRTQGIIKLTGSEPLQDVKPKYQPKIERDTQLSQLIDGGANPAPLTSSRATNVVIEKAKKSGFGIVGLRNTFSSNGAQAYYVQKMAENDLIGIMCSRSPAAATGFGSIDPLFGTNPIGFGFPTNEEPVVFDLATSAMTFYGLVLAKAKGEKIPENMAIDNSGQPTTDPEAAMEGALLSFDRNYKGSSLAMMIEVLAGPLVNSSWIDNKTFEEEWGSVFIAIDPNLLIDPSEFKNNASDMIAKIKNSRKQNQSEEIRLPGERAAMSRKSAKESGFVEIEDSIAEELKF
jgi:LDH2 family malate/lactate/ureidoglycolate dehydrogenase